MKKFRDNQERGKWAKIGLSLAITLTVILTVSNIFQLELLLRWSSGAEVDMFEAEMNDTRQEIIVIVYFLCMILAAISFLFWFRRAYFNLHQKLKTLEFNEGWAVGSWFVPFLNLVRPYKIMKELYSESAFWLKMKGIDVERDHDRYLLAWWILWIISTVVGRIVSKMAEDTLDDMIELTQVAIGAGILEIIVGLLAFKVISDYFKREQIMMEVENRLPEMLDLPITPNSNFDEPQGI
ncbi:DUF4328 domain-containing protein [Algoriphagus sp. Y33]|uniref:DUF4328 domain-containing protein n=1 Tax=Algoriphagus sp. Y33 TaxID=2772483 RepID=UPI00177C3963|nr:DUF4328 domain-containing protein [Algoriphagus sp. Y33]